MKAVSSGQIRELLRSVQYPGFSRDVVSAGFVKDVVADETGVAIRFAPNSTNVEKVRQMENSIRDALAAAAVGHVRIDTTLPFNDADMSLRKSGSGRGDESGPARRPITADAESDADIDRSLTGAGVMNPLQAELLEEGVTGEADVLRNDISRSGARLGGPEPEPFDGPVGPAGDSYDGALPVYQWDIDPHDPKAQSVETSVRIDDWDIRVWWQAHSSGDLYYASLQAMRDDWADHIGAARQHPVGRSAAVNLVYDRSRHAVVAIYGTVRDFRPFVKAFRRALDERTAAPRADTEENPA